MSFAHNGENDPHNRYKMPVPGVAYEHAKKGLTLLVNLEDVAKALNTPPEFLHHWLGMSFSRTKLPGYRLKGRIEAKEVTGAVLEFAKNFLWCPECKDPETRMSFKKGPRIKCKTCGYKGPLKLQGRYAEKMVRYMEKEVSKGAKKAKKVKKTTSPKIEEESTQKYFLPSELNKLDFDFM